jgi:hypothetical protein
VGLVHSTRFVTASFNIVPSRSQNGTVISGASDHACFGLPPFSLFSPGDVRFGNRLAGER